MDFNESLKELIGDAKVEVNINGWEKGKEAFSDAGQYLEKLPDATTMNKISGAFSIAKEYENTKKEHELTFEEKFEQAAVDFNKKNSECLDKVDSILGDSSFSKEERFAKAHDFLDNYTGNDISKPSAVILLNKYEKASRPKKKIFGGLF